MDLRQLLEEAPEDVRNAPRVKCLECGELFHTMDEHLSKNHSMTEIDYGAKYPGEPTRSKLGNYIMSKIAETGAVTYEEVEVDSIVAFNTGIGPRGDKPAILKGFANFSDASVFVPPIDEGYVFPPAFRDAMLGLASDGFIYAMGHTGCGKTTMFEQFAARTGMPWARIQFSREMEQNDLFGTWVMARDRSMKFEYSIFARYLQLPSLICLDEFDSGNAAVTAIANAVLEGKPLIVPQTGAIIHKHKDCKIVGTGNTNGLGDETGLYASTSQQSFATMNRWRMFIYLDYMPEAQEVEMLAKRFGSLLPIDHIKNMVKIANKVREGLKSSNCNAVLSTRQLINWGKWLSMTGDFSRSYKLAFANQLGPQDEKFCAEIYQRIMGTMP